MPTIGPLGRYSAPLLFAALAAAGLVLIPTLPANFQDGLGWLAWLVLVAATVALQLLFVRDRRLQRTGSALVHAPAALTLACLAILTAMSMLDPSSADSAPFWMALLGLVVGQIAWIIRLGDLPVAGGGLVRRLAIFLVALPTVLPAAWIALAIAIQGDVAWMAAHLMVPGLVVAPFVVLAMWQVARRPA